MIMRKSVENMILIKTSFLLTSVFENCE